VGKRVFWKGVKEYFAAISEAEMVDDTLDDVEFDEEEKKPPIE